jgi:hypothetical protein
VAMVMAASKPLLGLPRKGEHRIYFPCLSHLPYRCISLSSSLDDRTLDVMLLPANTTGDPSCPTSGMGRPYADCPLCGTEG